MINISEAVASSEYEAIGDDALKDEDNGAWLRRFPETIQAVWLQRFYWIRWVDRLAEQDRLVHAEGQQFQGFYQAWQRLYQQGYLDPKDRAWSVLQQIEACWFNPRSGTAHESTIQAWNSYLEAILAYHHPTLVISTLLDYEAMLEQLAGSCFQLLPFLKSTHQGRARSFGVVDQFYNNLRDLYEDSQQGICYFPTTLLSRFGVTRQEILTHQCFGNPGYARLMTFWMETYLPQLRSRHLTLATAPDLHPSWQSLTTWFLHRYGRIEQIMRVCDYNFVTFATQYWQVVEQELVCPSPGTSSP